MLGTELGTERFGTVVSRKVLFPKKPKKNLIPNVGTMWEQNRPNTP
jgi:hypothetical protein